MKRTYAVTIGNSDGPIERRSFTADDENDGQDAGAAAAEIAIEMIRESFYLYPGDYIKLTED